MELTVGQRLEEPHPQFSSLSPVALGDRLKCCQGGKGEERRAAPRRPPRQEKNLRALLRRFFSFSLSIGKMFLAKNLLKKNKLILQRAKVTG
jgi:hypothetical protein